ncbi:MAG: hypothetical protein KDE46_05830 [Caldilineaceae bacterium]|nr:hypothetical protein [Caldilineaceae bacterium]
MVRLITLRLLESYFRHRWLYLVPIVLLTGVAVVYQLNVTPNYITRSTLYIQKETLLSSLTSIRSDGIAWTTPAQQTLAELNELLQSNAYMRAIIQHTDLEAKMTRDRDTVDMTYIEARDAIWVQQLGDNLVLVGASHDDPKISYQLVAATTDTYIQWKTNLNREESKAALTFFENLTQAYKAQLEPAQQELTDYLTLHPEPVRGERPAAEKAEIDRLQVAADTLSTRLNSAESKLEDIQLTLARTENDAQQTYIVLDQPRFPESPEQSKVDLIVNFILFIGTGIFMSVLGIVGGLILDRSFRFPIDVRHGLNLPVLAMIPEASQRMGAAPAMETASHPVHLPQPTSQLVERPIQNGNGHLANGRPAKRIGRKSKSILIGRSQQ